MYDDDEYFHHRENRKAYMRNTTSRAFLTKF